jgi:NADH-quinone oxidoreductase subunit J
MFELYLFISLAVLILFSSIMVISTKNPVHSVLFLIMTFLVAAGLLFLLEVEFISLIFIVVYVGAIAVLFLFVVMMLDIKISEFKRDFLQYFPIGSFLGIAFLVEIFTVLVKDFQSNLHFKFADSYVNWFTSIDYITLFMTKSFCDRFFSNKLN